MFVSYPLRLLRYFPNSTSVNFSYLYVLLNIHFDSLRHLLTIRKSRADPLPQALHPEQQALLNPEDVAGCKRAFVSLIHLFEVLSAGYSLAHVSQSLRDQVYHGGRVLQVFYSYGVLLDGEPTVDLALLQRWQTCIETAETIWGYSARGSDLRVLAVEAPY